MKKIIILFAFIFLILSCKKNVQHEKTVLTFWHTMNEDETPTLMRIVEEFEETHPNIQILIKYIPFSEAQNSYIIAHSTGNAPDIFRAASPWVVDFTDAGYLLNLNNYISASDRDDYLKSTLKSSLYNDSIWGIPQVTDVIALFYNEKILNDAGFNKPPRTLEELNKMSLTIKQKTGIDGMFMRISYIYWYLCIYYSYGGKIFTSKGTPAINSRQSIDALYYTLNSRGVIYPENIDLISDYNDSLNAFKNGEVAMIANGPWTTASILQGKAFVDNPDNFKVAVFPAGPDGHRGSPVGGHHYVISSNTNYPDEAYKFLSFINKPKYQAVFAIKNNLLPTRKSTYEIEEVKNNRIIQSFLEQMQYGKPMPQVPNFKILQSSWDMYYNKVIKNELSPEEAMKKLTEEWNKIINE